MACLALVGGPLQAQTDSLARQIPEWYVVPKLGLPGALAWASYGPMRLAGKYPPAWPAWGTATVEVGFGRHALIAGLGGRYFEIPSQPYIPVRRMAGAKVIAGYRHYLQDRSGEGFYLQPTFKWYNQWFRLVTPDENIRGIDNDYAFSLRAGWQKRLVKQLHIDLAVGPGVGVRQHFKSAFYYWSYYFDTGVSEIDNPSVYLTSLYDLPSTTLYLIGDASIALGWKF